MPEKLSESQLAEVRFFDVKRHRHYDSFCFRVTKRNASRILTRHTGAHFATAARRGHSSI